MCMQGDGCSGSGGAAAHEWRGSSRVRRERRVFAVQPRFAAQRRTALAHVSCLEAATPNKKALESFREVSRWGSTGLRRSSRRADCFGRRRICPCGRVVWARCGRRRSSRRDFCSVESAPEGRGLTIREQGDDVRGQGADDWEQGDHEKLGLVY